jgi:hypothetical protein
MRQLQQAQQDKLKSRIKELKRIQKQLQAIHQKTGYEDLQHGVLALQIAEHAVEETLEYTGPGGKIQHKPEPKAHSQAKQWHKIVRGLRAQFLKLTEVKTWKPL